MFWAVLLAMVARRTHTDPAQHKHQQDQADLDATSQLRIAPIRLTRGALRRFPLVWALAGDEIDPIGVALYL